MRTILYKHDIELLLSNIKRTGLKFVELEIKEDGIEIEEYLRLKNEMSKEKLSE